MGFDILFVRPGA